MIDENQILEIREILESSASPLFYFDNDQDGLCSYLLLRRFLGRGNGVPVKTSPLGMDYYRRIREFSPDTVFVLDQPTVSKEFFSELEKDGIRVVWIDHHEVDLKEIPSNVEYYNPLYSGSKENIPVTAVCYEVVRRKEDLWLAVIGTISDKFIMPFYEDFLREYPDLGIHSEDAFEVFYNSSIGKLSRMFGIGLKDRTTNVVKMMRFLSNVRTPYEVLEEGGDNKTMHKRFKEIDSKFRKYIQKAKDEFDGGDILFFRYAGDTSMSADIANKLSYLYPKKYVVVAFAKEGRVNISMRGKGVREYASRAIEKIPLATCGGHEDAVGAQLDSKDLDKFFELMSLEISR